MSNPKMLVAALVNISTAFVTLVFFGCAELATVNDKMWHEKCDWKADKYFDDPQAIALCKAIEANDLKRIDELVAAGVDVNAQGNGIMTPLLWAFPDNKLERFKRLLEHGANPNVAIESDFNTRGGMSPGDSVTHMACKTAFPGYFEAVFEHGGDPDLIKNGIVSKQTPLFTLIDGAAQNKKEKTRLLLEKGADLDHVDGTGVTATMTAVGRGYYEIALMLLEAGADPAIYQENQMMKLAHVVVRQENLLPNTTDRRKADYKRLVEFLEDHGESIAEAKADEARWKSWGGYGLEKKSKLMEQEKRKRLAREAREQRAAEPPKEND